MRIFVISLPKAKERQQQVTRQLSGMGVEFEFFEALKAQQSLERYFNQVTSENRKEFVLNTGRNFTQGEIGCYGSHLALWEKCVELNEPIVIMEDDFFAEPFFPEALNTVKKHIETLGFMRLQEERRANKKVMAQSGEFEIVYYTKLPHSLMCYAITPSVASGLIASVKIFDEPVDVYIKKDWVHGQRMYGVRPYPIKDSELSNKTSITGRKKTKKSLLVQIKRRLRKINWFIQRVKFNTAFKPPHIG